MLYVPGDPDFVNVTQVELDILKNNYVESLRKTVLENDVLNLTAYGGSDYGVKEEDLDNLRRSVFACKLKCCFTMPSGDIMYHVILVCQRIMGHLTCLSLINGETRLELLPL